MSLTHSTPARFGLTLLVLAALFGAALLVGSSAAPSAVTTVAAGHAPIPLRTVGAAPAISAAVATVTLPGLRRNPPKPKPKPKPVVTHPAAPVLPVPSAPVAPAAVTPAPAAVTPAPAPVTPAPAPAAPAAPAAPSGGGVIISK